MKKVPVAMQWQFNVESLRKKKYLKDLDFIKANTEVNLINIATTNGAVTRDNPSLVKDMRELVEYAHSLGIRIVLRTTLIKGFFNNSPHIIDDQNNAQGLVYDNEGVVGEDGFVEFTQTPKWNRAKVLPLWNRVVKAYMFDKADNDHYNIDSLEDITDSARVIDCESDLITVEINAGTENVGKSVFLMTVQYFNCYDCFGDSMFNNYKAEMDDYLSVPFDGFCMDETGYMVLGSAYDDPFRARYYSEAQKEYFAHKLNIDFDRLLFDMRYAPKGQDNVRIKAINTYFEELSKQPIKIEWQVAEYEKKHFGEDVFLTCHNTFHNDLDNDEIWKTGCRWWDLPRDFGHTDENIPFPIRMGISLAADEPICIDMFYHKDEQPYYDHIIEGAPFNCRQFHHSYNDGIWGQGFTEPTFLKNIRKLDKTVSLLDDFQTQRPKLDLLIIFGFTYQNNWYPNYENRNEWDVNGSLKVLTKCHEIWNEGYRCALIPDYTILDGRTKISNNKVSFNGHEFSHVLFLYPQYAKTEVLDFLTNVSNAGIPLSVVGKSELDFNGEKVHAEFKTNDNFSISLLEDIGCAKSGIEGGCVYEDGSFSLVSHGILDGKATNFDFTVDGIRYSGTHTGLLAFREGKFAFATRGSKLYKNEKQIELEEK